METQTWIWIAAVAAAAVVIIALIAWSMARSRRTKNLQDRFGPEYDRAIATDGRREGETALRDRERKVDKLDIRALTTVEAQRFAALWTETQARFVDQPGGALADADRLVGDVMVARGYPVENFEARAADVSVDHPNVVDHFRIAHAIAVRHSLGQATTEEMRQAMIHYRALFSELLETGDVAEAASTPH